MDRLKKGTGSFITLPYKTHREKSMVAGLEGTKLERNREGEVSKFLEGLDEIMRVSRSPKEDTQKMCAAF